MSGYFIKLMRLLFLSIALFFLLFTSCSISVKDEQLDFSILFLRDKAQKETVSSVANKEMAPLKSPNLGYKNGVYWFKVILKDKHFKNALLFNLPESNIYSIDIYQNGEKINYKSLNRNYFSLVVNEFNNYNTFILKVQFKNEVYFPLQIKKYDERQLDVKFTFLIYGVYYGFVLVALILNLLFYFSLKDKTFLYYCFFLASITLGVLAYDGFLQLILPKKLFSYSSVATHFLITFSGYLFGYKFLKISSYFPKSKVIGYILVFLASIFYLFFFFTKEYLLVAIADTISFFVLLYNWSMGIFIFNKNVYAKFLVIGYSLILFSAALFILPTAWGIDMYTASLTNIKIGSFFEIIILTYGITYRIKILQKENKRFRVEIDHFIHKMEGFSNPQKSMENNSNFIEQITKFDLSKRESEVFELIAKGLTNKRIAEDLNISHNTVKYHIRNIYEKIGINSKNEAIDFFTERKSPK